ncbi:MAG: MarR family transcriptional regulator [Rhodobacteraceae bacterium]|nr:MarR family transcriptional regulator [Paracoccaceae bacterium]
MADQNESLAVALFSELLMTEQLVRNQLTKALPKGMEISHFSVLNHMARTKTDKTPAELARVFHVTRGAMTNTLGKLERAGHIHVRPDWEDARRKIVSLSPAGVAARDEAIVTIAPIISDVVGDIGADRVRATLPVLRELRSSFETGV